MVRPFARLIPETLDDRGLRERPWVDLARSELTPEEERVVAHVTADLRRYQPSLVNETTVFARPVRHGVAALAQCGVPGGGGLGVDVGQQREAAGRHGVARFPGEMFADPGLHLGAKFFRHRIRPVDR